VGKEQDRWRERMGEEWEAECGRERVAAWVINLAVGQPLMRA
jgi:hypothetical protein